MAKTTSTTKTNSVRVPLQRGKKTPVDAIPQVEKLETSQGYADKVAAIAPQNPMVRAIQDSPESAMRSPIAGKRQPANPEREAKRLAKEQARQARQAAGQIETLVVSIDDKTGRYVGTRQNIGIDAAMANAVAADAETAASNIARAVELQKIAIANYATAIRSNDPAKIEKAHKALESQTKVLTRLTAGAHNAVIRASLEVDKSEKLLDSESFACLTQWLTSTAKGTDDATIILHLSTGGVVCLTLSHTGSDSVMVKGMTLYKHELFTIQWTYQTTNSGDVKGSNVTSLKKRIIAAIQTSI